MEFLQSLADEYEKTDREKYIKVLEVLQTMIKQEDRITHLERNIILS